MIRKQITSVTTLLLLIVAASSTCGEENRNTAIPPANQPWNGLLVAQVVQPQPAAKDCCKTYQPKDCPAVKPCQRDACAIIQIAPIDKQDANFTYQGTHSFMNIFGAGVARGVENATIRAMNAIKVCPDCERKHEGECDPDKPAPPAPAPAV